MNRSADHHPYHPISAYLQGVTFPCDKRTLIECAGHNLAESSFLAELEALPDRDYVSLVDVLDGLGDEPK